MRLFNAFSLLSLSFLASAAPPPHGVAPATPPPQGSQAPKPPQAPAGPPNDGATHGNSDICYESSLFYTNWAIYGRKHFITDLPADKLTKILYAFANINNVTGEVTLSDVGADLEFKYPGDVVKNGTKQLLGNFNQLFKLKQKNRNLKVILSVGGWSYRGNFKPGLAKPEQRQKFCDSSLELLSDLGLDGFDIDWEYAEDATDASNFVDTLKRCRTAYDTFSAKYANNYHFEIGISAPAGPQRYTVLNIAEMDKYVDYWNLMAFDYQGGGFSNFTGHLSNVYASTTNPKSTDGWDSVNNKFEHFNTKRAIDYYKSHVSSPSKIQLGLPLYGRSFANVVDMSKDGKAMGQAFNGSGEGTFEPGTLDYKQLPLNGSTVYHDEDLIASWSWDKVKKEVVSYDTPQVAKWKVDYLKKEKLGGAWWWESSNDRKINDKGSLISNTVDSLGGTKLFRQRKNNLYYPKSKWDNIREAATDSPAGGHDHNR